MDAAKQKVQQALLNYQQQFTKELGISLPFTVDWDFFASNTQFTNSVTNYCNQLSQSFLKKGLLDRTTGLIPWLKKSSRALDTFTKNVSSVIIRIDTSNSINDPFSCEYYTVKIEDNILYATVRLDGINYTNGWGPKVDKELNLNVLEESSINEALGKLQALEKKFEKEFGSKIVFHADWDFINHEKFKEKNENERHKIIQLLVTVAEKGVFGKNGLIEWSKKSERVKTLLGHFIKQVVLKVTFETSIDFKIENSYYMTRWEDGILTVTARFDNLNFTSGWGPKVDLELNLRAVDEEYMREGVEKLNQLQNKFTKEFGYSIPIEIDWSFVDTEEFKKQADKTRKEKCLYIVTAFAEKGIFNRTNSMLEWAKLSPRVNAIFKKYIYKIVLKMTTEKSVDYKVGNSYYSLDWENGILTATARMDSINYTDGWGPKLDHILNCYPKEEVAMRQVEEKLKTIEGRLQSSMGKLIELKIDWHSLMSTEQFKTSNETNRKNYIQCFLPIFEKGLFQPGKGLATFAKTKQIVQEKVNIIVVGLTTQTSVDFEVGSPYYMIRYNGGGLLVTVRMDNYRYTDGWGSKVEKQIPNIMDGQSSGLQVPVHPLLAPAEDVSNFVPPELPKLEHDYLKPVDINTLKTINTPQLIIPKPVSQPVVVTVPPPPIVDSQPIITQQPVTQSTITEPQVPVQPVVQPSVQQPVYQQPPIQPYFTQQPPIQQPPVQQPVTQPTIITPQVPVQPVVQPVTQQPVYQQPPIQPYFTQPSVQQPVTQPTIFTPQIPVQPVVQQPVTQQPPITQQVTMDVKEQPLAQKQTINQKPASRFPEKYEKACNEVEKKNKENEKKLNKAFGRQIDIEVDWSFLEDPGFASNAKYDTIIRKIQTQIYYVVSAIVSIVSNQATKEAIEKNFNFTKIVFKYDTTDSINAEIPPHHIDIQIKDETLIQQANLKDYNLGQSLQKKLEEFFEVHVPNAQGEVQKEIERLQKLLAKEVGKEIPIVVDYSFTGSEEFQNLPTDKKVAMVKQFRTYCYNIVQEMRQQSKDEICKNEIAQKISKVVIALDPTNQIEEQVAPPYFKLELSNSELHLIINFKDAANSVSNMRPKFERTLNVKILQGKRDIANRLPEIEKKFLKSTGTNIVIDVDYQFCDHQNFLERPFDDYTKILNQIPSQHIYNVVSAIQSSCNDKIFKETFAEKVEKLIFTYDPTNNVKSTVGSEFFDIFLKEKTLWTVVNLDNWTDPMKNVPEKLDPIFNLRVEQGIRDIEIDRIKYEQKFREVLQTDVSLEIDWSFTTTETFLNRPLVDYTTIIKSIQTHLYYYHSLFKSFASRDSRALVLGRNVKKIVFTFDAGMYVWKKFTFLENKINSIIGASHYEIRVDGDKLILAMNLNSFKNSGFRSFEAKIYPLYDVFLAQEASVDNVNNFHDSTNKNVGKEIKLILDWESFIHEEQFLNHPDRTEILEYFHQNHTATVLNAINHTCNSHPFGKQTYFVRISAVEFKIDLQLQDLYKIELMDDKFVITLPLSCNKALSEREIRLKMEWQLGILIELYILIGDIHMDELANEFVETIGKKLVYKIDWAFTKTDKFLALNPSEMNTVMETLFLKMGAIVIRSISEICLQHAVGQKAVLENINNVTIHLEKEIQPKYELPYILSKNGKTLEVSTDYILLQEATSNRVYTDYIKFLYDWVVPVAQARADPDRELVMKKIKEKIGKNISIEVDLSKFVKHQAFLSKTPMDQAKLVEKIVGFAPQALVTHDNGLIGLSTHPIGKQNIIKSINHLYITADPTNSQFEEGAIILTKNTLSYIINLDSVTSLTFKSTDYKSRISFALNVIVDVAKYDAEFVRKPEEERLQKFVEGGVQLFMDYSFAKTNAFRDIHPAKQSAIIYNLSAPFTKLINSHLLNIAKQPTGKKVLQSLKQVCITADPNDTLHKDGEITYSGDVLKIVINKNTVDYHIDKSTVAYWKSRILHALGILREVSWEEITQDWEKMQSELNSMNKRELPVEVDWSFTKTQEFKDLFPEDMVNNIKNLFVVTSPRFITSEDGFVYLSRFEAIRKILESSFSKIIISVKGDSLFGVEIKDKVLHLSFSWNVFIQKDKVDQGCAHPVEDYMKLRPHMEQAAIANIQEKVQQVQSEVQNILQHDISVYLDWNALIQDDIFKTRLDYVKIIDTVGIYPNLLLLSPNGGVLRMLNAAKEYIKNKIKTMRIKIDMTNETQVTYGRFSPECYYVAEQDDSTLLIVCNQNRLARDRHGIVGVCDCIEWLVCPVEAKTKEQQELQHRLENPCAEYFPKFTLKERLIAFVNLPNCEAGRLFRFLHPYEIFEILARVDHGSQLHFFKKCEAYAILNWTRSLGRNGKRQLLSILGRRAKAYIVFGKIERVDHFGDVKVQVGYAGDIRVSVKNFASCPGEWEYVESFGDWKVEMVNHFGDFTVEFSRY